MTWEEVRDLERERTVAILPVGAVEAHGPHLPLGTDVIIARAMARAGAAVLAESGWGAVLLPPIWYSAAPFAREFPGTVGVGPDTLTLLVGEIAASLRRQEFAALALANAHLDPEHLASLERVVEESAEGDLPVVAPNLARGRHARRLTREFQSGACHAGRFEGSVILAEAPALVRTEVARGLAPNPASLSEAIAAGHGTFHEAGGPRAYFGWPAEATAVEGRETVAELGRILAEAVLEEIEG
ncbi:MAG: creatininase family protein [Gemmatimonadota bacterium]